MAKNTGVSFGNHFAGFITPQIKAGCYRSASEVVRAGLRLLEDNENKLAARHAPRIRPGSRRFSTAGYRSRSRAMMLRWISLVPSPIT